MATIPHTTLRRVRGAFTLWHLVTLLAFSGGVSVACQQALAAGDGIGALAAELVAAFAAGLAAHLAATSIGRRLERRAPVTPEYIPTLRSELPFVVLYAGAFIGIMGSIVAAGWLVRLVF